MNKKFIAVLLAGSFVFAAGCGSKTTSSGNAAGTQSETTDYKAGDYVTLGKYKGVEVTLTKSYKADDAAVKA